MDLHISPTNSLQGTFTCPGDKSISHRAALLAALAEGTSIIHDFLLADDCLATLSVLQQLGVNFRIMDNRVEIDGVGLHGLTASKAPLDCRNAGTTLRLLAGILAAQPFTSILIGDQSLSQRPMQRIIDPLRLMGAHIDDYNGCAPLICHSAKSSLRALDYVIPMASAQVQSCLLFAGLYASGVTKLTLPNTVRNHTLALLMAFGVNVNQAHLATSLQPPNVLRACTIDVVGDISSAAFFMVAASIAQQASITIKSVGVNPTRIGIIRVLQKMGADIQLTNHGIDSGEPYADITVKHSDLIGITIPPFWVPDLIDELPVLLLAASCASGQTCVRGASELRVKESDRLFAMAKGLQTLGVSLQLLPDGIIIDGLGQQRLSGGIVDSYADHRIAMTMAIAAMRAKAPIVIQNADCIANSFPTFIAVAEQLGLMMTSSTEIHTEES